MAASPLYPQVGYQGDAARQKAFIPVGPETNPTFNVFSGLLNVAWEIDVWGRIRRSTEAARANFLAGEDALAQTQRDQLLAVVSLYKALGGGWQTADDAGRGSATPQPKA